MKNKGITFIGQINRKSVRTGVTLRAKIVLPIPKDGNGNPVLGLKTNEDGSYRDNRESRHEVTVKEIEPDNYNKALEDLVSAIQLMQSEEIFDNCNEENIQAIRYIGPIHGSNITYKLVNEDQSVSNPISTFLTQEVGGKISWNRRPRYGEGEILGSFEITSTFGEGNKKRSAVQTVPVTILEVTAEEIFGTVLDAKGLPQKLWKKMITGKPEGNGLSSKYVQPNATTGACSMANCDLNAVHYLETDLTADGKIYVEWQGMEGSYWNAFVDNVNTDSWTDFNADENENAVFKIRSKSFSEAMTENPNIPTETEMCAQPNLYPRKNITHISSGSNDTPTISNRTVTGQVVKFYSQKFKYVYYIKDAEGNKKYSTGIIATPDLEVSMASANITADELSAGIVTSINNGLLHLYLRSGSPTSDPANATPSTIKFNSTNSDVASYARQENASVTVLCPNESTTLYLCLPQKQGLERDLTIPSLAIDNRDVSHGGSKVELQNIIQEFSDQITLGDNVTSITESDLFGEIILGGYRQFSISPDNLYSDNITTNNRTIKHKITEIKVNVNGTQSNVQNVYIGVTFDRASS